MQKVYLPIYNWHHVCGKNKERLPSNQYNCTVLGFKLGVCREYPPSFSWHHVYVEGTRKISQSIYNWHHVCGKNKERLPSNQYNCTVLGFKLGVCREYPPSFSWHHVYVEGTRKISTVYITHIHLSHNLSMISDQES